MHIKFMAYNTLNRQNDEPRITDGWVYGNQARQYEGSGNSYDLGNMFGLTDVDERLTVGVIYIRTASGNIYAVRREGVDGVMVDMRRSEEEHRVVSIDLSQSTLASAQIIIGQPFRFEAQVGDRKLQGHTSPVAEFVIVEDGINMSMAYEVENWREDLAGTSDFEAPAIFEASQQAILAQDK